MSRLLLNERPLQVLPKLAAAIGLNEAIFLQQLHYWLTPTEKYEPHWREHEGARRPWVYNTYNKREGKRDTGWEANFPFWSARTIKRIVQNLREISVEGHAVAPFRLVITTDEFNDVATDRTLWYSIDYREVARLEALVYGESDNLSPSPERDKVARSKGTTCHARRGQLVTLESDNLSPSNYTETTSETTPETTNRDDARAHVVNSDDRLVSSRVDQPSPAPTTDDQPAKVIPFKPPTTTPTTTAPPPPVPPAPSPALEEAIEQIQAALREHPTSEPLGASDVTSLRLLCQRHGTSPDELLAHWRKLEAAEAAGAIASAVGWLIGVCHKQGRWELPTVRPPTRKATRAAPSPAMSETERAAYWQQLEELNPGLKEQLRTYQIQRQQGGRR